MHQSSATQSLAEMPHRIDTLNCIFASMLAALTSIISCLAAAVDGINIGILTDTEMRFACIAGSLGGAMISVILQMLFAKKPMTCIFVLLKFTASGLSGVIFAPIAVRWLITSPYSFEAVLAISAITAMSAIGILRIAIPRIERLGAAKLTENIDGK